MRGEVLSTDHWVDLFGMLGMQKTLTIDKLTFGHFIKVSDAIVDNADKLKVRHLGIRTPTNNPHNIYCQGIQLLSFRSVGHRLFCVEHCMVGICTG